MFGNYLKNTARSATWAATLLGIMSLVSRFIGVFRDRLLSGTFGAGTELDAYYAAFRAPDLIFSLLVSGAISAGFIPVFTRLIKTVSTERVSEKANEFACRMVSLMGLIMTVIAIVGVLTAHLIVPLYTSGFDLETQQLAINMTRLMMLSPVFLGLSAVFSGVLQTYKRFAVYSLAPVFYNLGIVSGTVFLVDEFGIYGVAIGVIVGSFLHMSIQLYDVLRLGYKFRWLASWNDSAIKEIGRMMIPRTAGLALENINIIILTGVASTLGAGSIAVFSLALNLQSLPIGVLGASFAVAAFPFISELAERGDRIGAGQEISRIVRIIMFLIIPATVSLMLLRAQIVRVILGSGNFDWSDTIQTADALAIFSISLFAQALLPVIIKVFFAFRNVSWPLIVVLSGVIFERILAWYLVNIGMGVSGLVLAFSVSNALRIIILWSLLRIIVGNLNEKAILRSLSVMMVAAVVMAITIQSIKVLIGNNVDMQTFAGVLTQGGVAGLSGIAIYFIVTYLLGNEEAKRLIGLIKIKLIPVKVIKND